MAMFHPGPWHCLAVPCLQLAPWPSSSPAQTLQSSFLTTLAKIDIPPSKHSLTTFSVYFFLPTQVTKRVMRILLICFALGLSCYNVSFPKSSVQSTMYLYKVHTQKKNELEKRICKQLHSLFHKIRTFPAASEAEGWVILATIHFCHPISCQPPVLSWVPERHFACTLPSTCNAFFRCRITSFIARHPPPPARFRNDPSRRSLPPRT